MAYLSKPPNLVARIKNFSFTRDKKSVDSFLFNISAFLFIASVFMLISWWAESSNESILKLQLEPVTLDHRNIFEYSMRTVLRMFIAIIFSLIFTFIYAKLMVANSYLEEILMPILDILQSVPILGFISFTVTVFLNLFPGNVIGVECAAIFAIFTSQAWNMTYSFYQSLKNLPNDLLEICNISRMSSWQKFWKLELPFAIPSLVWNMAISISSGWFFVVASEVISVGNKKFPLPGLGSYISLAIQQGDLLSIILAVIAIILSIIFFDQIFLKPLLVWADNFQYPINTNQTQNLFSWVYSLFDRDLWIKKLLKPLIWLGKVILYLPILNINSNQLYKSTDQETASSKGLTILFPIIWYMLLSALLIYLAYQIINWLKIDVDLAEVKKVFMLTMITFLRIVIMGIIVSIVFVPLAVYIGLRPKVADLVQSVLQILAAFPANLLFPIWAIIIKYYNLNPNIWLTPLLMVGAQWYILFNVVAGSMSFPQSLKDVVVDFNVRGKTWWNKVMVPFILPYFITGIIVAIGGAWNACIVAEYINYKGEIITATGIGSYISHQTMLGNLRKITFGILMMVSFVVILNRIIWMPLYNYSMRNLQS